MKFEKMHRLALSVLFLGALAACDNPVSTDHDDAEADGVVILSGTTELARVVDATATGALTVSAGATSPVWTVAFLDHDGDLMTIPSGHYVEVTPVNAAIAEWQPNTPGAFSGRIHGKAAGTTLLRIELKHGAVGSGHAIFTQDISLTVTQ